MKSEKTISEVELEWVRRLMSGPFLMPQAKASLNFFHDPKLRAWGSQTTKSSLAMSPTLARGVRRGSPYTDHVLV